MNLKKWIKQKTEIVKDSFENEKEYVERKKMRYETFLKNHLIPNVDLELSNYSEYVEIRRGILISKFKELLS